jgi:dihydroorotate dehydrogenase
MTTGFKIVMLRAIAAASQSLNHRVLFRRPAQESHDSLIRWLRILDRMPFASEIASALHHLTFTKEETVVGGARLSHRLMLAAGLVKGDGFTQEAEALQAVRKRGRNIIPGWRILPALVGPVEFGSFTRYPRIGNAGTVVWRHAETRSTQNRVGLRNPGAQAAALFLGKQRGKLPKEYGINIAVSPGVEDIDQQTRDVLESLEFFLDASLHPTWFTLNLSCPNTEDDPQGHQLEAETRQLCSAFIERLRSRDPDIPLWVKISPGLAAKQYYALMRVFSDVGVKAVVAANTLPKPCREDASVVAGVGGGELFDDALAAIGYLRSAKKRGNYKVDLIGCGGILDGETFAEYRALGVEAAQYWSAIVYRGPFAAAIIESELARHECEYETIQRESLA